MNKILTVIMAFRNEGEEVALTCKSIRETAGDKVDIICVDDASNDQRNYVTELEPYNVKYYRMKTRVGSSQGKQIGIELCETSHFIVLDAHCRFYTKNWLDIAEQIISSNPDNILYCCGCQFFTSELDHQDPKHVIGYGAYFRHQNKDLMRAKWNVKKLSDEPFDIPVILGANYICSKSWWEKIDGHKGLIMYGREEEFVSLKTWMMGGKCMCIPGIVTGHKGRTIENPTPFVCLASDGYRNELVIAYICLSEIYDKLIKYYNIHRDGEGAWKTAKESFGSSISQMDLLKKKFDESKVMSFTEYDEYVNKQFREKINTK